MSIFQRAQTAALNQVTEVATGAQPTAASPLVQKANAAQNLQAQLQSARADYAALMKLSGGATGQATALESNQRAALARVETLQRAMQRR